MARQGIDHFTKEQFEDALPKHKTTGKKLWECAGCIEGEYTYTMPVELKGSDNQVRIEIRSSIGCDGTSADTGEDSIRAWLIYWNADLKEWHPLGSKVQRWINRLPGWNERLVNMLRTLYNWRLRTGDCPVCHRPRHIFKVKDPNSKNVGRIYAKCTCTDKSCARVPWVWLDESTGNSGQNGKQKKD